MPEIKFTPEKFTAFKQACKAAEDSLETEFTFEGHKFLVTYAKYMIEYLSTLFNEE